VSFDRIETERLILRPLEKEDAEVVFEWAGDPLNTQYVDWPCHKNIDVTKAVIADFKVRATSDTPRLDRALGIQLKTGTLIGSLGLHQDSQHTLRGGWVLEPRFAGKQYASEASLALFATAFAELPWLQEIHAALHPMNHRAVALAVRLGFRVWGSVYRDFPQLHLKGFEVPLYRLKRP
jgi:ribosomal-protein-alanine N-acetyltransferase